ncbi:MAG: GMC family oxidoreductase, partial [Gammaproteobacteria bacterium]|nr:GMC family oxidoreductase [Gammaproteobacteria bacterium]
ARLAQLRAYEILREPLWPWTVNGRDNFVDESTSDIGYAYNLNQSRVKGVGGSTLHWGGLINRFRESDFRTASTYGLGVDWPLSYADLEPWYGDAETEIGVAGTQNPTDPPRSRPLPMEHFPAKYGEAAWFDVGKRLDIEIGFASHARNSRPYSGRPACSAFSVCNVCPIGARYSADFHVDRALATGNVTLLDETVARRIVVNDYVVQSIAANHLDGSPVEIRADRFIIAAHAVETARLLLLSDVGNSSGQVGRNLMEHWYTGAGGFIDSQVFPRRIGFETLECNHWYDGPDRETRGAIKMSFIDGRDPLETGLEDGMIGSALARLDCDEFGHWVGVGAEIEHQPNADSQVKLSESEVDMFGDPVPQLRFALSDTDRRTHTRAQEIATYLLEARGCRDIAVIGDYIRAHHHMGTCRMAADPADGVVDANCRVHGIDNLFLAGASVFPTGAGRQPTLTVAALALRLAAHVVQPK